MFGLAVVIGGGHFATAGQQTAANTLSGHHWIGKIVWSLADRRCRAGGRSSSCCMSQQVIAGSAHTIPVVFSWIFVDLVREVCEPSSQTQKAVQKGPRIDMAVYMEITLSHFRVVKVHI